MKLVQSFYTISAFVVLMLFTLLCIDLYPPQLDFSQSVSTANSTSASTWHLPLINNSNTADVSAASNASSFQTSEINPVLKQLNLYSPAASNLILGTAIQESFLGKLSKNMFQISLRTAKDVNQNYLTLHPELKSVVDDYYSPEHSLAWNLNNNVKYEIAMARIIYLKTNRPLPSASDIIGLGKFWKVNYNTYFGKGTARQYANHFEQFAMNDKQVSYTV